MTGVRTAVLPTTYLRIWLRSPLRWTVLSAVVFMLVSSALQLSTGRHGWTDSLGFLNLWVVAAGPLFTALTTAHLAHLDRSDRSGGLDLRDVSRAQILLGRSVTSIVFTVALHCAAIGTWFAVSALTVEGVSPAAALTIAVSLAASYLWFCVVLSFVGMYSPVIGPTIVLAATVVIGVLESEAARWYLFPPAWMMRSVLGAIGTHANGTSLGADSLSIGPVPFVGSAVLAIALLAFFAVFSRRHGRSTWAALIRILGGPAIPLLSIFAVGATAVTLRWRPAADTAQIFGLLVLPMGCTVLSALGVQRVRVASRRVRCPAARLCRSRSDVACS